VAAGGIDAALRLTLREGSIYYFVDRALTSAEPHFFFVINSQPLTQQVLVLGICTSKVAEVKARRRDCPECLVELDMKDLPGVLKKPSIVDCNTPRSVPLAEFNTRFVRKEIRYFDKDLPEHLRKAMRAAIHASKLVPAEIKALITAP
jgi:hypothetical protein